VIDVDGILLACQPGDQIPLTYEIHLLLWLQWLPAVEAEVLAIVSWVYNTPVTSPDILLTRCQNLVSCTCYLCIFMSLLSYNILVFLLLQLWQKFLCTLLQFTNLHVTVASIEIVHCYLCIEIGSKTDVWNQEVIFCD